MITYETVLADLEKALAECEDPDGPIVGTSNKTRSMRQVVEMVRNKTTEGMELVNLMIVLSSKDILKNLRETNSLVENLKVPERWDGMS